MEMLHPEQHHRLDVLRESIREAFPAERYDGAITPVDGQWTEDLDEDLVLYQNLRIALDHT
jgi:hypothetical protein